jgi:uncharacterized membrane protein YidH (DUF202 family)
MNDTKLVIDTLQLLQISNRENRDLLVMVLILLVMLLIVFSYWAWQLVNNQKVVKNAICMIKLNLKLFEMISDRVEEKEKNDK